jgi:hypothetical protein
MPTPIQDRQFWYPTASIAVERSFAPGVAAGGATPLLQTKKTEQQRQCGWIPSATLCRFLSATECLHTVVRGAGGGCGCARGIVVLHRFQLRKEEEYVARGGGGRRGEKKWQHVGWWSSLRVESGCRGFQDLSTASRYNPQERLLSH